MNVTDHVPDGRLRQVGALFAGIVLLALPIILQLFGLLFYVGLLIDIVILCLFAMGYNFLFGHTGLLSFGHAAYYGIGAYIVALTLAGKGWFLPATENFLVALAFGIGAAVLSAAVIGYLCVQRGEIYFAMLTIAFNMMVYLVSVEWTDLTGGTDGTIVQASEIDLGLLSIGIQNNVEYYYFTLAALLISIGVLWRIQNSSYGEILALVRDNPERARFIGINVTIYQWSAFVLSALFAGLAGGLISPRNFIVTPTMLHWTTSADPVMVTLLGGFSTFLGPVIGAISYVLIEQFTGSITQYWQLSLGIALAVIVLFLPEGILGAILSTDRHVPAPVSRVLDRIVEFRSEDGKSKP